MLRSVMTAVVEGQRATCRNCGRDIAWSFDVEYAEDDLAELDPKPTEYGWWFDSARDSEVCAGPPGDASDRDWWHEPI